MNSDDFQIGDNVMVTKHESLSLIPVQRLIGFRGRIVQRHGKASIGGGQPQVLFKVELEEPWHGPNRYQVIPADVLAPSDGSTPEAEGPEPKLATAAA